jgi:hypothetical protein
MWDGQVEAAVGQAEHIVSQFFWISTHKRIALKGTGKRRHCRQQVDSSPESFKKWSALECPAPESM